MATQPVAIICSRRSGKHFSAARCRSRPYPALWLPQREPQRSVSLSGVPVLVAAGKPGAPVSPIVQPWCGLLAAAQGAPIIGNPATVIIGTGSALLQNALAAPPSAVWKGAVYALALVPGPFWAWEG